MKILQNRGEKYVNYQSSCELSHIQQKIILEKQAKATIISKPNKPAKKKLYNTTLWISLPDKPGKLGEVTTLIGIHKLNISSVEMKEKTKEYINFRFNLTINDLKNFTNFISELKQKQIKFKIIRHENKKNAFTQKIFKYFKKN